MTLRMTPRIALLLIAALFVVPLAVAWLMYSGVVGYEPGATRNLGQLVEPPVPITWDALSVVDETGFSPDDFSRHWVLLHTLPGPCDPPCEKAVSGIRQIHKAAGRDQARVRLALLQKKADPSRLHRIYEQFHVIEDPSGELWSKLAEIAQSATVPGVAGGGTFIVDPFANVMMYYAPSTDPNDIKTDLERLLKWSKQDQQ